MFAFFGLGLQELIVLAACIGLPVIAGGVALVLLLVSGKKQGRENE